MKMLVMLAITAALIVPATASITPGTYDVADGSGWNEAFNGWNPLPRPGDIGNNVFYAGGNGWSASGILASVELVSSTGNTFVYESVYVAEQGYNNVNLNYGGPWSPDNLVNYQALIEEITVITTKTYAGAPMEDESNLTGLSFSASGSGQVMLSYPKSGSPSDGTVLSDVAVSFTATSTGLPTFGFWEPGILMDMSGTFDSAEITIVPEPATMMILALGGLFCWRKK